MISDTHRYHRRMEHKLVGADVLAFAGDMCGRGHLDEVEDFAKWLDTIKDNYKKIIVIAGNHDWAFVRQGPAARDYIKAIPNAVYLEDEEFVFDGVKFYGSPWQPWFHNWAFNVERGPKIAKIWENIPEDTDVLITHGPPHKILDKVMYDHLHVGCEELIKRIDVVKPKIHLFGHIHETYGHEEKDGIHFVNASICNRGYDPINNPFRFFIDENDKKNVMKL